MTATHASRTLRVAPAAAALIYPGVIWCGPAVSPVVLGLSLVVPILGAIVVRRTSPRYAISRAVALASVTAPPLFSWLGGLLDFQKALPFNSLGIWIPLWAALLFVAFFESPREPAASQPPRARLAFAHGVTATIVLAFALPHLVNHLAGLWSGRAHIAMMGALRLGYRQPIVETILLAAVAFQALSGARLLVGSTVRALTWPETLQRVSGAYIAVFLLSHLTAALRARHLRGIDTNWTWLTSDSMLTDPWSARLAPYYFLGIVALGIHAGLGLRHVLLGHNVDERSANACAVAASASAVVVASLIMTGLLRA